jgi:hypothetical protein
MAAPSGKSALPARASPTAVWLELGPCPGSGPVGPNTLRVGALALPVRRITSENVWAGGQTGATSDNDQVSCSRPPGVAHRAVAWSRRGPSRVLPARILDRPEGPTGTGRTGRTGPKGQHGRAGAKQPEAAEGLVMIVLRKYT